MLSYDVAWQQWAEENMFYNTVYYDVIITWQVMEIDRDYELTNETPYLALTMNSTSFAQNILASDIKNRKNNLHLCSKCDRI